jgi:ribosomal protein S18 acetylase RimI-like enzyme
MSDPSAPNSYPVTVEWTIRTSQSTDLAAVIALWGSADVEPSHTDDVGSLQKLIDHDPLALIVALDDGTIVGSIIAAWDGWRGSIYRLVVAPTHRGLGMGTELLRHAEARLSASGAVRLQAAVVDTSTKAMGFWRATGWEEQVHRARFVSG